MKLHYQETATDCLRCAVATLLQLELSEVPDFYESECNSHDQGWDFNGEYDQWLKSRGLMRIIMDINRDDNNSMIMPFALSADMRCIGTFYHEGDKRSHAAVIEIQDNDRIEIVHDPKPNSKYDINDLVQVEMILTN